VTPAQAEDALNAADGHHILLAVHELAERADVRSGFLAAGQQLLGGARRVRGAVFVRDAMMAALLVEVLKDRAGYDHDPWLKDRGPGQLYRMQHELFEGYDHGPMCGRHVLPGGGEIVCHLVSFTPPVEDTIHGPKKQVFSLLLSRLVDVSGHVHVCVLSGRVHICEEGLCKREIYNTADGHYMCEQTATVRDNSLSRNAEKLWGHAARLTTERDGMNHTADDGGDGLDDGAFEQINVELVGFHAPIEQNPLITGARKPVPASSSSSSSSSPQRAPAWKVVKRRGARPKVEQPAEASETNSVLYYLGRSETGYGSMLATFAEGSGASPLSPPPLGNTPSQAVSVKPEKKPAVSTIPRPTKMASDQDLVLTSLSKGVFESDYYAREVVGHLREGMVALDQWSRPQKRDAPRVTLFEVIRSIQEREPMLELGFLLIYGLNHEERMEAIHSFFRAFRDRLAAYLLGHAAALHGAPGLTDTEKINFMRVLCAQLFTTVPLNQKFMIPLSELFFKKTVLGERTKAGAIKAGYTYKLFKGYQHPNISF